MALARTTAAIFLLSSAFPVVAGLSKDTSAFPAFWGVIDVALAFVLAVLAMILVARAGRHVTRRAVDASYRAYRVLIHGILVALMVFFVAGDRIVWVNCLTGLAWRAWLLLYALPAWLTLLESTHDRPTSA